MPCAHDIGFGFFGLARVIGVNRVGLQKSALRIFELNVDLSRPRVESLRAIPRGLRPLFTRRFLRPQIGNRIAQTVERIGVRVVLREKHERATQRSRPISSTQKSHEKVMVMTQ